MIEREFASVQRGVRGLRHYYVVLLGNWGMYTVDVCHCTTIKSWL